jgi:IS30 family transposase
MTMRQAASMGVPSPEPFVRGAMAADDSFTNENTNRLYLPKGADLRAFSQVDLDASAHELNHRPRKTHGYRSPTEVYADLLNRVDALTA